MKLVHFETLNKFSLWNTWI